MSWAILICSSANVLNIQPKKSKYIKGKKKTFSNIEDYIQMKIFTFCFEHFLSDNLYVYNHVLSASLRQVNLTNRVHLNGTL